jgi:hypothetical protein
MSRVLAAVGDELRDAQRLLDRALVTETMEGLGCGFFED